MADWANAWGNAAATMGNAGESAWSGAWGSPVGTALRGAGSTVLDNLKRTGDAGRAFAATPGDWNPKNIPGEFAQAGKNAAGAFMHGTSAADAQAQRDKIKSDFGIKGAIDKLPAGFWRGAADTGVDAMVDPMTGFGLSGVAEKAANAAGRAGYTGLAKGLNKVPGLPGDIAREAHDFVSPGGSAMGALKRTLAAEKGGKGQDLYTLIRSTKKAGENAGEDPATVKAAVAKAVAPKPHIPAAKASEAIKSGTVPTTPLDPRIEQAIAGRYAGGTRGTGALSKAAENMGSSAAGRGLKTANKGLTDLMFATPQWPGIFEGHGQNVLQMAAGSDPLQAAKSFAQYYASGEPIPFSGIRNAYQKLPGVGRMKEGMAADMATAQDAGAVPINPDFGAGAKAWTTKVPILGHAAEESERSLAAWDNIVKSNLYKKWLGAYSKQYGPKMAQAKAAERVGQDVVDYGDRSDLATALRMAVPFGTYLTKKPGVVARTIARHPERVLAATRNNPNFNERQSTEGFDQGRPLTWAFNAANNASPAGKPGPFAGAQAIRGSAGPATQAALGMFNPYFTYGPPARRVTGKEPEVLRKNLTPGQLGWLKLGLSQLISPIGAGIPVGGGKSGVGDELLRRVGMDYFP